MNNRIKTAVEEITLNEKQKSRMLSRIENEADRREQLAAAPARKTEKRSGAKFIKIAAAAAVLCCLFGMTAFAEEIGSLFNGLFVKDEIVADTVLTGVYTDSSEHLSMAVEELLSDGMTVRAVVRYQALDEQGKTWLDVLSAPLDTADPNAFFGLDMSPEFPDDNLAMYGVGYSHGAFELEELRTENERCFVAIMEAAHFGWGSDNVVLKYGMTSGPKATTLSVSTNIEKITFALDAQDYPDKTYTPLSATISPLSLVIEGEQHGFFESGYADGLYYTRITSDETVDSLLLCFKDGTKVDLLYNLDYTNGASTLCSGNQSQGENHINIVGVSFVNPIDISAVAGFELDGVYFELN